MEMMKRTTNRKLENYLYALGIKPDSYRVLWDGMVEWSYQDTELFREACETYRLQKARLCTEMR